MSPYTYNAPQSDYAYCILCCLATAQKGTKIADIRKIWGRKAPIVKCNGELFLLTQHAFETLAGNFPRQK